MTDSTDKCWIDCCTTGTIYLVQFFCWFLALYLLFSNDHTCPCNDEICCRNLVNDDCPPNHCFCMPTTSILEEEGQCVHDISEINRTLFCFIIMLFIFPFLLQFLLTISTCCHTVQKSRSQRFVLLPVASNLLDSSSNTTIIANNTL